MTKDMREATLNLNVPEGFSYGIVTLCSQKGIFSSDEIGPDDLSFGPNRDYEAQLSALRFELGGKQMDLNLARDRIKELQKERDELRCEYTPLANYVAALQDTIKELEAKVLRQPGHTIRFQGSTDDDLIGVVGDWLVFTIQARVRELKEANKCSQLG